jgi:hypothetical protein
MMKSVRDYNESGWPDAVAAETTLREAVLGNRKGETQWETRAAKKTRKRARNSTTKN